MTTRPGTRSRDDARTDTKPVDLTTYVGRESEIGEAQRLIASVSVVTMTGPGGVGKTRLSGRLIDLAAADFRDGAVFVPLAELHDPSLLTSTLAELLGLGDRSSKPRVDAIVETLRDKCLLLVLDNCEHLIEECAHLVDAVARNCPDVVVLCTSRQSLGVDGERILPVRPLSIPEPGEPSSRLHDYDAVRLFLDRARAVVPDFAISDDNADDVVRLCHQLDGLPLAIELAAVRLRALSVRQISERLDQRFTLLGGPNRRLAPSRHETLQALIDWSYELCSEQEQLLWSRLSVFAGSVYLDAAESVCSGDGIERHDVLPLIEGLIDKSVLLRVEQRGEVRYAMLETIRQYGAEQLDQRGNHDALRRRHRDYYVGLTRRFSEEWLSSRQMFWVDRIRREINNLRLALDYCTRSGEDAVVGLDMAYAFKEYWVFRGFNSEGRMHTERLLEVAPQDAPGRAKVMWNYAFLALVQGDREVWDEKLNEAQVLADRHGDTATAAYVVHVRAYGALIAGDMDTAAAKFAEASAALAATGDRAGELWARYNFGLATALRGDLDLGRDVLRECIAAYTEIGEVTWRCWALWSLGAAEYLAGDLDRAASACGQVLRQMTVLGDDAIIAFALTVTAGVATQRGEYRRAARLFGASMAVWKHLDTSPRRYGAFSPNITGETELVTGKLGDEVAGAEFMIGYGMSVSEAVEAALDDDAAPDHPVGHALTPRQLQVAELVAKGMTNREIAETLVISLRTAETHVDHILTKLGFSNRVQVAAWAGRQTAVAGSSEPTGTT